MSEKHIQSSEVFREKSDKHERSENIKSIPEVNIKKVEQEKAKKLEEARAEIEHTTTEKAKVLEKISESTKSEAGNFKGPVSKELKKISLQRELKLSLIHI